MALLRMEEAASRLGVSLTQLRMLLADGIIRKVIVGSRGVRVDEADLERYIQGRKAKQE